MLTIDSFQVYFCDGPQPVPEDPTWFQMAFRLADGTPCCCHDETVPHMVLSLAEAHRLDSGSIGSATSQYAIEPAAAKALARKLEVWAEKLRIALESTGDPRQASLPGVE